VCFRACVVVIVVLVAPGAAEAATFSVNDNGDQAAAGSLNDATCTTDANPGLPNTCTLRAAIQEANGTAGTDEIQFTLATPAIITLAGTQLPVISGTLTITGPGAANLTVAGNLTATNVFSRVFETAGASTTTITGLTIANGFIAGSKGADNSQSAGGPGGDARGAGIHNAGTLTVNGVTVRDNTVLGGGGGTGGTPTTDGSGFAGGAGGVASGAGILNTGTLTISGSTLTGNRAEGGSGGEAGPPFQTGSGGVGGIGGNGLGGAIANEGGTLMIGTSTLRDNSVTGGVGGTGGSTNVGNVAGKGGDGGSGLGGAISSSGSVTITGSTINGNEVAGFAGGDPGTGGGNAPAGASGNGIGAGIQHRGAQSLTITNATISGNLASTGSFDLGVGYGGGIATADAAPLVATHVTLVDNQADFGTNLGTVDGPVTLRATIIASLAATPAADNCHFGTFVLTSQGFNLDDGTTCGFAPGTDRENVEPQLGPLAANGGPTQTHLPLGTSQVVDAVTAGCPPPATDQRGTARAQGAGCEIGAVENTAAEFDADSDGLPNNADNCPDAANADQGNADGDGPGDACDSDDDNDAVADGSDNCPALANADQGNADGDGPGDACDSDDDNDGAADAADNCPTAANPDQANTDGDGPGNACDPDDDNDSLTDSADNCSTAVNAGQADLDGDGLGDACDPDDDNDGVADALDNCTGTRTADRLDTDADGIGNACDPDDDNDGFEDAKDRCSVLRSTDRSGCPAVKRTVRLKYDRKRRRFNGTLTPRSPQRCAVTVRVTVRLRRPGPDRRIGTATTRFDGRFVMRKRVRRGVYYATVVAQTVSDVAACKAATSRTARIR
jgi:hypothetical protein